MHKCAISPQKMSKKWLLENRNYLPLTSVNIDQSEKENIFFLNLIFHLYNKLCTPVMKIYQVSLGTSPDGLEICWFLVLKKADFGGKIWLLVSIATDTLQKNLGPFFIISHQIEHMYQVSSKSVTMRGKPC